MPQNAMPQKRPEDMSLEELEEHVLKRAREVSDLAEQRYGVGLGAASSEELAPVAEPMAIAEQPAIGVEGEAPPEVIASATALLVAAGLLAAPSETLTPEVLSVLAQVAEQFAPGLYDMASPAHVTEILDGIINGTIPITTSAPEPGPEPLGERPSGLPYGGIY